MSTMKDKLANSVRQAKSGARPATAQRAVPAAPAPKDAPAAAPVPRKAAVKAATVAADQRPVVDAQNPASSAKEIFPRRVWPD